MVTTDDRRAHGRRRASAHITTLLHWRLDAWADVPAADRADELAGLIVLAEVAASLAYPDDGLDPATTEQLLAMFDLVEWPW